MDSDCIFRHLMQELFSNSYVNELPKMQKVIKDFKPEGPLTKSLLKLLLKAFEVLVFPVLDSWEAYLDTNMLSVTSSPKMYISYAILLSWTEVHVVEDQYARFLIVLTLVNYMARVAYDFTGRKFYKLSPKILTVLFDKVLKEDFYKGGGWKSLKKHILNKKYSEIYDEYEAYDFNNSYSLKKLMQRIQDIFLHPRPSFEHLHSLEQISNFEIINDLTRDVMSLVETSLVNELNLNTEQSLSKVTEGSKSSEHSDLKSFFEVVLQNRVVDLEDKLRELISVFELLDTK
ncbi:uncharacterized protein TNIN_243541 [Trichonephila inaurata madagascariensis]|uniref:Uncharacterized protein n=1 Tax=Trichonephila inaurata madagascariensis TaxID=2747483 RepID=A0A8X6YL35_9ARAC|nr:uncharacterized protein TNIN_243541 [Trichonephila inaurata madagascariensis]